jgi:hypothetical protein
MKTPTIDELRKKYYDGDASLEEERLLKRLLQAPDAPPEWKEEAELMEILSTPPEVVPPAGFERRILERLQREPGFNAEVQPTPVKRIFRPWVYATAVAAAMMGFVFIMQRNMEPEFTVYSDTCHTAEEAKAEIENALLLVANTLILGDVADDLGGPCD